MKINSKKLLISFVLILVAGIAGAKLTGLWITESTKEPVKFTEGEFVGQYDPEDIRGSYTFCDIENAFGVKAELIAEAFNIKTDDPCTVKAKDLELVYGYLDEDTEIGTGAIKLFVAFYTGLPHGDIEYLPSTAVEVLKREGKWTTEMESLLEGHIIEVDSVEAVLIEGTEEHTEEVSDSEEETMEVKGSTTFADVISWGIEKERIEEIVGFEIDNVNLSIRDACEEKGVLFSEVKTILNEEIE